MDERIELIEQTFKNIFNSTPEVIVKSPGRVDLLGIHTDYNDGFVLPIAVNLNVIACGSKTNNDIVTIHSINKGVSSSFNINNITEAQTEKWSNYNRGVIKYLLEAGFKLGGANIVLESNLPIGSGLSSSAALENATGVMFQELYNFDCSGTQMALIGQKAENLFVGVNTGIMDQFVSRNGLKDHALFLDCRSLEYQQLPLDCSVYKVVVCDTRKRRGLVDSEYDSRRKQCEEAVTAFKQIYPNIKALRDVTLDMYNKHKGLLTKKQQMRALHVISENERGLESVTALQNKDFIRFGQLMNESHNSARDLYEVSCDELEAMVEVTRNAPGAISGRLAGAGFGGCSVSLVEASKVNDFIDYTKENYFQKTGLEPQLWACSAENGARRIN